METASIGTDAVDRLLGGSLVRGKVYLLEADNGTQPHGLIYPFVKEGLDNGELIVYASNEAPAEEVLSQLRDHGIDVDKAVREGRLIILDLWSETTKRIPGVICAGNPSDPHKVLYSYEQAYQVVRERKGEPPSRVVMDTLSGSVTNFGFERAHRLASRAVRMMKLSGAVGLSVLVPKMHPPTVAESFEHLYDGVIQLTLQEEHGHLQKYIRVLKSPLPGFDTRRLPYEATPSGFVLSIDLIDTSRTMKAGLHQASEGVLHFFGKRCFIIHSGVIASLIQRLLARPDKGAEIYSRIKESAGRVIIPLLKGMPASESKDLLQSFSKFMGLLGLGDLEFVAEPDGKNYTIILRHSPIGEALRGFGSPVDFIHAALIAFMLEAVHGIPYHCEEIRCAAQGELHCEFRATPSKGRSGSKRRKKS